MVCWVVVSNGELWVVVVVPSGKYIIQAVFLKLCCLKPNILGGSWNMKPLEPIEVIQGVV